jgi:hypothetical protein
LAEFQLEQGDSNQGSGFFTFWAEENGVPNPLTHAKIVHNNDKQEVILHDNDKQGDFASIETSLVTALLKRKTLRMWKQVERYY